jgi:hypothetical protein
MSDDELEPPRPHRKQWIVLGILLSILAFGVFAITDRSWTLPATLISLIGAAIAFTRAGAL